MANVIRYRKPSVNTLLGVTKVKKRVKKALGINAVLAPFRMVGNFKRRTLDRAGYYSPQMKAMRAAQKGQVAGPLGALQIGEGGKGSGEGLGGNALLMAAMMSQGGGDKKGEGMNPLLMGAMMAGGVLGGEGKGGRKSNAPGLGEALLLSAAMAASGSKEKESKAKSTSRAKRTTKEKDEDAEERPRTTSAKSSKAAEAKEAQPRATRAKTSKTRKSKEEESESKERKGFRLFG